MHQAVHLQPGLNDHRGAPDAPVEVEYGLAHPVQATPGGWLAQTLDGVSTVEAGRFMVNSVHGQGVSQLAPGLVVEARAPDGLIEAFRWHPVDGRPHGYSLCVQWHPEWQAADNPVSVRLFQGFGQACRAYMASR